MPNTPQRFKPRQTLACQIHHIPGGYTVDLADGRKLWIYGREPEVARAANSMALGEAETLAKDVARARAAQWARRIIVLTCPARPARSFGVNALMGAI